MNLDMEARFKAIIKKISDSGELYAEAKRRSWYSQEMKGVVLSKLIKAQGDIAVSKAEINAKASEDYEKFLEETSLAIEKEYQTKAEYEKNKSGFEALRSLSSLEKRTQELIGD